MSWNICLLEWRCWKITRFYLAWSLLFQSRASVLLHALRNQAVQRQQLNPGRNMGSILTVVSMGYLLETALGGTHQNSHTMNVLQSWLQAFQSSCTWFSLKNAISGKCTPHFHSSLLHLASLFKNKFAISKYLPLSPWLWCYNSKSMCFFIWKLIQ